MNADPAASTRPRPVSPSGRPPSAAEGLMAGDYLLLAVPMALFCGFNLFGGAAQPMAALWFAAATALLLPLFVLIEARRGELQQVWPGRIPLILFATVILIAGYTVVAPATDGIAGDRGALSLDRSATLVEIIKLCALAGVFCLGCFEGLNTRRAAGAIRAVLAVGAVWAVIGVVMMATGLQIRQDGRLTGGFMSANSGATVFGVLLVLSVAVLSRANRNLRLGRTIDRWVVFGASLFCVVLFTGCILATASRMGVAAAALAVAVLLVWETLSRKARPSGRTLVLTICGLALAGLGLAGADLLWSRVANLDADATNRGVIFTAHWRAFLDAPLFGHGLGSFTAINNQQMTPENYGALRSIRATHNVYIQWLEEAGLVGALPMFALIGAVIASAVRRSTTQDAGAGLQRGLIAANIVVLVHGTTDYALQVPAIAALWAYLLGLQFASGRGRAPH